MDAAKNSVMMFPLKKLIIDHRYQRPLDEPLVRRLVAEWDDNVCGLVKISKRMWTPAPHEHALVDGQHREVAVSRLGREFIAAEIILTQNLAQEARLFTQTNSVRKQVTSAQIFRAAVIAGDQTAIRVDAITKNNGFEVSTFQKKRGITAAGTLVTIFERSGPDILDETLSIISQLWGNDDLGYCRMMLDGMSILLAACTEMDRTKLVRRLQQTPAAEVIKRAKSFSIRGSATGHEVARALGHHYNFKVTTNRIDFIRVLEDHVLQTRTKGAAKGKADQAKRQGREAQVSIAPALMAALPIAAKKATKIGFNDDDLQDIILKRASSWKTANAIRTIVVDMPGFNASLSSIGRLLCEKARVEYPTNAGSRNGLHNKIRRAVQEAGDPLNLLFDNNHVYLVE